jgi:hypothetical protein
VQSLKGLEDSLVVARLDAYAVVGDRKQPEFALPCRSYTDAGDDTIREIFQGIADEVQQQALETERTPENLRQSAPNDLGVGFPNGIGKGLGHPVENLARVEPDPADWYKAQTAEIYQIVKQAGHRAEAATASDRYSLPRSSRRPP